MVSELALFDKILGIRVKGCHWYELRQNQRADGNAMTYNTVNGVFSARNGSIKVTSRRSSTPGRFQTDRDQQRDGSIRRGSGRSRSERALILLDPTCRLSTRVSTGGLHGPEWKVMPVSRHTMNSSDVGPLAECSYEETVTNLERRNVR
jgi:hypothetical protein